MKLIASFFLDGLRIVLQRFDTAAVFVVLILQHLKLALQISVFGALLTINHHSIGSKHNVDEEPSSEEHDRAGGNATMFRLNSLDDRAKTCRNALTSGFRLRSAIHERAQMFLRLG